MRRFMVLVIGIGLVIAGCGGGETDGGGEAATPASDAFTVTHDGSRCTYEGPDELIEGSLNVTYINDSDEDVALHFAHLFEGVKYFEYKETIAHESVDHLSELVTWQNRAEQGEESRGELSETVTVSSGLHALTCIGLDGNGQPESFFGVGPITVTTSG